MKKTRLRLCHLCEFVGTIVPCDAKLAANGLFWLCLKVILYDSSVKRRIADCFGRNEARMVFTEKALGLMECKGKLVAAVDLSLK